MENIIWIIYRVNLKSRLDILLVDKKIIESRQKAKAVIMAGKVFVDGLRCDKPGTRFYKNIDIECRHPKIQYVSRGGLKLESVFKKKLLSCQERICLDVGASTGGFTDCLLKNGASMVFAVDVGYGQLAWKLRKDSRVIAVERTNARYLNSSLITRKVNIITIDVSFISLKVIVPAILSFLDEEGVIIALIKPQFEVGKGKIGKKGVVKSSSLREEVIVNLKNFFEKMNLLCGPIFQSPLIGPKGNKEFFIFLKKRLS